MQQMIIIGPHRPVISPERKDNVPPVIAELCHEEHYLHITLLVIYPWKAKVSVYGQNLAHVILTINRKWETTVG